MRRRVHVRRLRLDARIGLDDPADTGRLWGLLWPMLALAPTSTGSVRVQPDFSGEVLWIDAEGQLWLRPLAVLAAVLAFLAAPAVWRIAIGRRRDA